MSIRLSRAGHAAYSYKLFGRVGLTKRSTLLAAALPICATLMSAPVLAVDAVGDSARNIDVAVGAAAWTVLTSVNFNTPTRFCTATGSADAFRPTPAIGQYRYLFTVSDTTNPPLDQGQERALEFLNHAGAVDNTSKEITTTGGRFTIAAGPGPFISERTIYFLARKATAATPNLTVADASLTVTCTDNRLAPAENSPAINTVP